MPDFELRDIPSQPTVVMHAGRVSIPEIPVRLAEMLPALWQFTQRHGITVSGPPFVRYSNMGAQTFDLEAGFPVPAATEGEGDVEAGELPAGTVATGWHIGPYATIGETYDALIAWAAEQGKHPVGDMWEVYWSDPEDTPPEALRTQVICPVA